MSIFNRIDKNEHARLFHKHCADCGWPIEDVFLRYNDPVLCRQCREKRIDKVIKEKK